VKRRAPNLPMACLAGIFCLAATQGARDVAAQRLAGQVRDSTSRSPVSRGFVVLLDLAGRERARVLTDSEGRFQLDAPEAGQYRLRSERIGYRAWTSSMLEVHHGQILQQELLVPRLPVVLATVEVRGRTPCRVRRDGEDTGLVWDEIQKALAAAAWTASHNLYRHTLSRYDRDLTEARRRVLREERSTTSGWYRVPYFSAPPERLAAAGYVVFGPDTVTFYAPDANVLLDSAFLATHCFRLVKDESSEPGMVGVAFEPLPGVGRPDVEGVLWVDRISAELQRLEFRYTGLHSPMSDPRVGGSVEFLALPSGAWVVHRWVIRTPITGPGVTYDVRVSPGPPRLVGFREFAGRIDEIVDRDGRTLFRAHVATIQGTVNDSLTARPLAGARVSVVGTAYEARTDSVGQFRLLAPLEGEYDLRLSHPVMDSLGLQVDSRQVAVAPGRSATLSLATPSPATVALRLCGAHDLREAGNVVVGFVTLGGAPAPLASVTASWFQSRGAGWPAWRRYEQTATANDQGQYRLCRLPEDHVIGVSTAVGRNADRFSLRIAGDEAMLMKAPLAGTVRVRTIARPLWRADIALLNEPVSEDRRPAATPERALLLGMVTAADTLEPVHGAQIVLDDSVRARTDADGLFAIDDVSPGAHALGVRAVGFTPQSLGVEIPVGEPLVQLDQRIALERRAVDLPEVVVTGRPSPRGKLAAFERRRSAGVGAFIDSSQIARSTALTVSEVIGRVPGISLVCPEGKCFVAALRGRAEYGVCGLAVYVDGVRTTLDDPGYVDFLSPAEIAAIEVYPTIAATPLIFSGIRGNVYDPTGEGPPPCGVVAIWTKGGQ